MSVTPEALMKRILTSIPLLYLLMLWSGWRTLLDLIDGDWYYPQMMLQTGLLSIWFLTLTLSVTPTLIIINRIGRGAPLGIWLLRRRKHFGLMCFIFSLAHLLHYIRHASSFSNIWIEAFYIEFAVGWLAFVIFTGLAITSNRVSVRKMGKSWKPIHRLVYVAAGLSFLHWYLFDELTERVLFWLAVLLLVKLVHIGLRWFTSMLRQFKTT